MKLSENSGMKVVDLRSGVSTIDVARRFHAARPFGTKMIRFVHTIKIVAKGRAEQADPTVKAKTKEVDVWRAMYVGPEPDLTGLL